MTKVEFRVWTRNQGTHSVYASSPKEARRLVVEAVSKRSPLPVVVTKIKVVKDND